MSTDDRRQRRLARSIPALVAAALSVFLAAPATAQLTTGTISGQVADEGGLALPGASVTITNTETGATRTVTTDSQGNYLVTALPPGLYRVNVTMSNFRPFLQEEFRLAVGQNARVDARLEVGGVTEEVSVVASSLRVDTRSSAVVTVVDPQRMQELPMLNRSVLTLAVLAPGITDVSVPDAVTDQRSAPTVNSAATGSRTNQNDLQLDGATLTTSLYNRASNLPSPDSIQEFQVLTNSYSAEYGRGGGTSLLAITKSGGNRFRWSAWEYYRDDALNGVNYFAVTKPYMLRNQFGANFGGPIKRDKTFFFINYERLHFDQQQILTFNPPTAAQRAGDFSASTTIIFPYVRNDQGEGIFPAQAFSLEVVGLDWRPGYMHQFNLTYQRQLGDELVVSAGYVGSRGRDLTTLRENNLAVFIPGASTPQNVQSRRPDQNFTNVILAVSGSWSDYDSLQVTAMKRYTDNYTVQLTYTLGRTYDDGGVGEAGSSVQDPANPRADNALANNDRTHVLRLNGIYELPRFQGLPPIVRDVLGGWRVAGIMSFLSGTMFNVTSGVDRALQGCGGCSGQRPNLNGDPELPSDRSREEKIATSTSTPTR
jgi:hypothetical protein